MENQIFTNPSVKPDSIALEAALGKSYKLFMEFEERMNERNLTPEWNYYRDGKSWLCKILYKKKNYAWLSVWNTGFKLTFFFTEKTIETFFDLDIDDKTKDEARSTKPMGKFRPVILLIKYRKSLNDALKILAYKMTLK